MNKYYDYLIVGAGIFGATCADLLTRAGKNCLVVEKSDHIAGHIYTEEREGIHVHVFGAHIFHTAKEEVWDYVNSKVKFNRFTNSPVANYKGELYSLPFNMNTFNKLWGVVTPDEARAVIEAQRREAPEQPANLEEQAIRLVGRDIYERLVKDYTEKQWGRACTDLPAFIIRRLPVRFTYDNNYFDDPHQGIPVDGYTRLVAKMLEGIDVLLETDFLEERFELSQLAKRIIYTGTIDSYFEYSLGKLEYRSLRFETEVLDKSNHQGVAVMNYTDKETPFTRIIEHKHFAFGNQPKTIISREYPKEWEEGDDPYYPINDSRNQDLYQQYARLAATDERVLFGGRLAEYKYYNMDQVIASAMDAVRSELGTELPLGD
ncbi:MAG: UDP-galactopyranose mutase [Clostridia bacterium]|nr:UDP-galactopyranose mutase [Clostridia bacterium]